MAKYLVSGYTFSPGISGSGSITISGIFPLEQFLLATNVTDNTVVYQFNSPAKGGSVSSISGTTSLFLNADTSGMSAGDKVQLFVDDGADIQVEIANATVEISNDNGNPLTVDGRAYSSSVSFNRPGNTSAYTAGDVIGVTSGGAAGSAIHTFTSIGPSNGHVMIQSVEMFLDASTVPAGMGAFRLHLYNTSPSGIIDNAAFDLQTTDRAKYIGYADLSTPLDFGSVLYSQSDYSGRLLQLASGSTSLFGILQTVNAYTPASGTAHEIRIKTIEAGL
jgi:hypothetical protein